MKTKMASVKRSINERIVESQFNEIAQIIAEGRMVAYSAVNESIISTYWRIGKYINEKIASAVWGDGIVEQLADFLQKTLPDPRGFSDKNLWRMRQFHDLYSDYEKLSTVLRELPWSSHLLIISKTKTKEEREFYLQEAIKERYSVRVLKHAIQSCLFERTVASPPKLSPMVKALYPSAATIFRDVKKPHEKPSVGIILCKEKDNEVVEYALARTNSPAAIAEYTLKLPDKRLLQSKLHEFFDSTVREMECTYGTEY